MMMYRIFQIAIILFMQVYLVYNHLVCPKTDVVDDFDSEKVRNISNMNSIKYLILSFFLYRLD